MTHAHAITIRAALLAMLCIACLAPNPTAAGVKDFGCSPTLADPCSGGGSGGGGYSPPSYNYEAERQAQEAAAAELKRQQDEAARIERDRIAADKKRKEEQAAKFIRDRDEAIKKLKGSSPVNTGLKELRGSDRGTRDTQGTQTAWKQLHCAAEIAGYALAALGQRGDYSEFGALSVEAMKSLDGQRIDVVCTAAPPFPDGQGRAMDMEQGKQTQRTILSRAAAIVERTKQRGDQPTGLQAPAQITTETPEDKLRRVQRELNTANSEKNTGKTQQDMDQQERDRKELTKLILVNNSLEKGELTNMSVSLDDEALSSPPKPGAKPVPAP